MVRETPYFARLAFVQPLKAIAPWLTIAITAVTLAACSSSAATSSSTDSTISTSPVGTNTAWVKDSTSALNVFLPDQDSVYWFDGYGTADGARTVVSGQVPTARYWSFTAYPVPHNNQRQHVHDTQIDQSDGRYTVTMAQNCAGVSGTCMAMGATNGGVLIMRLYVPVDVAGAGTGGVSLPTIGYVDQAGKEVTLDQATGNPAIGQVVANYRDQNGALPAALTQHYPAPVPVPVPVSSPTPVDRVTYGTGPYANPDNVYEHIAYATTRGNLVVTAKAPTYESDSNPKANDLARIAGQHPQVRYWSLCTTLKGRHTGDCLRDEQVSIPPDQEDFTVIVSPTCPVVGYGNCLLAGPEPLQSSLAYRNLLPSAGFKPIAFTGAISHDCQIRGPKYLTLDQPWVRSSGAYNRGNHRATMRTKGCNSGRHADPTSGADRFEDLSTSNFHPLTGQTASRSPFRDPIRRRGKRSCLAANLRPPPGCTPS